MYMQLDWPEKTVTTYGVAKGRTRARESGHHTANQAQEWKASREYITLAFT